MARSHRTSLASAVKRLTSTETVPGHDEPVAPVLAELLKHVLLRVRQKQLRSLT